MLLLLPTFHPSAIVSRFNITTIHIKSNKMRKMTIEEMENYVMLEEMRATKNESTVTYNKFLEIMDWSKYPTKNQSKSNASINRLRK